MLFAEKDSRAARLLDHDALALVRDVIRGADVPQRSVSFFTVTPRAARLVVYVLKTHLPIWARESGASGV